MSTERLVLSEKYKAFLRCDAPVEFLEGTTAAGKTTVGLFKFMCKVAESPKKLHILAADDTGTAEKNIINKDLGILDDFGILAEYKGNGSGEYKMPHILFHTSSGDKIIFVIGYGNKSKWKDALGGQYGCLYIDEVNTANIDFVREASMRCDYLIATLNPDDPSLDVYKEYINCSRPLPEWEDGTPQEIKDELSLYNACEVVLNKGLHRIFVSLGTEGCLYMDQEGRMLRRKLKPCEHMVNATGAGDAFTAAMIYATLEQLPIESVMDYAMAAGIAAIGHERTINPQMSISLLESILKEYKQ